MSQYKWGTSRNITRQSPRGRGSIGPTSSYGGRKTHRGGAAKKSK